MKKFFIRIITSSFAFFAITPLAFAASDADSPIPIPNENQTALGQGPKGILFLLNVIMDWIFTIFLVLAVLFIILAAFNYLTSSGSEEKVQKANKMLVYTAVAIAVAVLARAIVYFVRMFAAPGAPLQ